MSPSKFEITVSLTAECSVCGYDLVVGRVVATHQRGDHLVEVQPCERCLNDAREQASAAGN